VTASGHDHGVLREAVLTALGGVEDPEIHRPITDLGMVAGVTVGPPVAGPAGSAASGEGADVVIDILLTTAGCPLRDTLQREITAAARTVAGVGRVGIRFGAMDAEQRAALTAKLRGSRGGGASPVIPFSGADSRTQVIAVASGKGGVGKSSVTAALATTLADRGLTVGILDADIYGHSIPRLLGLAGQHPTVVDKMILPLHSHGVRVISTAMFKPDQDDVVAWRGPMLDRALTQFLTDVHWGDLDVLLLDLPPGTGDVAISVAQRLPTARLVIVTTPQQAAAEVAERAGTLAKQTGQRVSGVVENMSWLSCPHCGGRLEIFGSGGGARVSAALSERLGYDVPLLAQIPLEPAMREAGDAGRPATEVAGRDALAAITELADRLIRRERTLLGRSLGLTPVLH
jgi:ATP-binding protein involved in chromosome partitioning